MTTPTIADLCRPLSAKVQPQRYGLDHTPHTQAEARKHAMKGDGQRLTARLRRMANAPNLDAQAGKG